MICILISRKNVFSLSHRHMKKKRVVSGEFHSQRNLLMIVGDNVAEENDEKKSLISSYEYKSTSDRISKLKTKHKNWSWIIKIQYSIPWDLNANILTLYLIMFTVWIALTFLSTLSCELSWLFVNFFELFWVVFTVSSEKIKFQFFLIVFIIFPMQLTFNLFFGFVLCVLCVASIDIKFCNKVDQLQCETQRWNLLLEISHEMRVSSFSFSFSKISKRRNQQFLLSRSRCDVNASFLSQCNRKAINLKIVRMKFFSLLILHFIVLFLCFLVK